MKKHNAYTQTFVLLSMFILCCPVIGAEEEGVTENASSVPGVATVGGRFSSDVQEGFADLLFAPFQATDSVALINLRGSFLEGQEQEINAGLVLRKLLGDSSMILGANLYYDSRWTEYDNRFDQVGAGVEILSHIWDVRANVYYPFGDEQLLSKSTESSTLTSPSGSRNVATTTTSTTRFFEEALRGADGEVGVWLPFLEKTVPTGLFAGYYHFEGDETASISGMRLRLEARLTDNLTVDAEWFEDAELNQTEYFAGIRIHVPWGKKSSGDSAQLDSRMFDMVNRDFRIRTRKVERTQTETQQSYSSRTVSSPVVTRSAPVVETCTYEIDPVTGLATLICN